MHRIRINSTIAFLLVAVPAAAQDIDPTVEVSRIYQGKMMEVHKPMIGMQIPDSVMHFDLDFDYSVFDNPYKGTYEFNPYVQDMKPQSAAWSGRRLFLRAGAGYPLHPVFDFVWSPDLKGKFRMSTYVTHRSYIGKYRGIVPVMDESSGTACLESPQGMPAGSSWKGYDSQTSAGVDGRVSWDKGIFTFNVGYYGLATSDTLVSRGYNAFDAGLRVRSSDRQDRHFLYDVSLDYRYGVDNIDGFAVTRGLSGHELSFSSVLGPVFSESQRFTVGIDLDMVSYGRAFGTDAGRFAVIPEYQLSKGRWRLGLGVRLSAMFNGGEAGLLPSQDTKKGQYVYPDIKETDDSATIQRKLDDFENDMKSLEEQGLARRKRMPLGVELKMKSGQKPEHMVSVMINGQEYVMYINGNPRAAQALNGKTNPEGEENIFWEYYNKAKRLYGGGLTSNNPDFVAANFVRDSIHSATMQFLNNGFGSSARFVLNTPKSFKAVFRGVLGKYKPGSKTDQYFQEFIQNGGETGYTAIHTIEDYKREYEKALNEVKGFKVVTSAGKKGFEGIIKALEVANRIAEDVNRFNAYMSSREAGKTVEESIDAAKNITVNFNKKGALGKGKGAWAALAWFMNKWILFFNPAVQGLYQVGQSAANNKKRVAGTLATIAASGFIMPYLNALLVSAFGGDDKDDYFYQTDYTRMNNWLIFTGNGYVRIPLPPFFREIYGMGDVFYRLMTNRITPERAAVATMRQLQSAIGFINLIPEGEPNIKEAVSGIMPDLIAPLMDVALNRDFTGRDIAKDTEWTKNLPEYERIYKGVSPVYVEFSRMLNQIGGDDARRSPLFGTFINPAYMEHLITSYTGGIGRTISNLTGAAVDLATGEADNIEFRTIPIINRFGSPVTERSITSSVNRVFYDYLERYEAMKVAEKRYKEFIKDGRTEYRDQLKQMKSNGESDLIRYFDMKMKTVRKLQNILKDNPDNKKVEQRIIELKSEMVLKAKNILK